MSKKRKQGIYLMVLGVVLMLLTIILSKPSPEIVNGETADFEVGDRQFFLEKLVTPEQRVKGLSGRETLDADRGLLFVFDNEDKHGIWMKDMKFPISIIWLDSNCKVAGFKDIAKPESYPEVFYPELPSKYVIEVNPLEVDVARGTHVLRTIGSELKCRFLPQN